MRQRIGQYIYWWLDPQTEHKSIWKVVWWIFCVIFHGYTFICFRTSKTWLIASMTLLHLPVYEKVKHGGNPFTTLRMKAHWYFWWFSVRHTHWPLSWIGEAIDFIWGYHKYFRETAEVENE